MSRPLILLGNSLKSCLGWGGNNQIDHSRAGGKSELGGKLKARGEEGQGQGMPCRRNGVSAVWSGSPQLGEHV